MRASRLRRQRGVTLMELLISLVVIVIGMLVIFRVLSTGVQGGQTSSRVAQAQQRAETIIEAIRRAPAAAITCLETTPAQGWGNCETTCKSNQLSGGAADASTCIFTVASFALLKGPLNPGATRDQVQDRQGQNYFTMGDTGIVSATAYGSTYVFKGYEGLRTAEIGVTIGWNDDNTTNKVPAGGVTYPSHTVSLITAMPHP